MVQKYGMGNDLCFLVVKDYKLSFFHGTNIDENTREKNTIECNINPNIVGQPFELIVFPKILFVSLYVQGKETKINNTTENREIKNFCCMLGIYIKKENNCTLKNSTRITKW